jgi:hypothetical protein
LKSIGFNVGKLVEMAPLGLQMMTKGKMSLTPHKPVENVEDVRRIYNELEGE